MNFGKSWNKLGRKGHRWERRQPEHRAHLGFLEHKKDYTKRAKLYHKKQDELQRLKLLASLRNPDEFHSDMVHSKFDENGKLIIEQSSRIGKKKASDLHSKNSRFLRLRLAHEKGKLKRALKNLHCTDASMLPLSLSVHKSDESSKSSTIAKAKRKDDNDDDHLINGQKKGHIIFVDNEEERRNFNASKHFDTPNMLIDHTHNRLRVDQLIDKPLPMTKEAAQKAKQESILEYWKVQARMKKVHRIDKQRRKSELKQKLAGKDKVLCYRKRSVSTGRIVQKRYKWPKIRKR